MELLDHLAFNHFEHHSDLWGQEAKAAWKAMPKEEREEWHERMLASMEVYESMSKEEQVEHNRQALKETLAKNARVFNSAPAWQTKNGGQWTQQDRDEHDEYLKGLRLAHRKL
jgi:hypothetical protein